MEKRVLPIKVQDEELEFLISKGYLVKDDWTVGLTDLGRGVFEGAGDDLFEEFFSTYPHKVPDGMGGWRVLGTKNPDTQFGSNMRKKWNTITKNNRPLQEDLIAALKYELELRKRQGSLQYMQGMEVWFNKATWEKYIDEAKNKPIERKDKIL